MQIDMFQVDAFANGLFSGNPAAVCPLDGWIDSTLMQNIALENNLAETAFFVRVGDQFELRWFTPLVEVDLCGHATLASAHVLFNELDWPKAQIQFSTRSGILGVQKSGDFLTLDFPTDEIKEIEAFPKLIQGLGIKPIHVFQGKTDLLCIYQDQDEIINMTPDFRVMSQMGGRGVIVSAPGKGDIDFVSRGFFPQSGIDEDPATGSAHTTLTPYWSNRLNKKILTAHQLSERMGFFQCRYEVERVLISGKAFTYMKGTIDVPNV